MKNTLILVAMFVGLVALPACNQDVAQAPETGGPETGRAGGISIDSDSPVDSEGGLNQGKIDGAYVFSPVFSGNRRGELQLVVDNKYIKWATDTAESFDHTPNIYRNQTFAKVERFCRNNKQACYDDIKFYSKEIVKLFQPWIDNCRDIDWAGLSSNSALQSSGIEPQQESRVVRILVSTGGTVTVGLGTVAVFKQNFDTDWQEWTSRVGVTVLAYFFADFFASYAKANWGQDDNRLSDTQAAAVASAAFRMYLHMTSNIASEARPFAFPGAVEANCPSPQQAENWIEMAELPGIFSEN